MYWSDEKLEWTDEQKRTLRALEVGEDGPGTILHDFQMLLLLVQERDLRVSKVHQLPPLKALSEINRRLSHPIALGLKRPQLKSYPNITGLYLLLRASGLGRIRSTPSRPLLAIDEAGYASWSSLSLTERYFTLLETWLLRGNPEIVGDHTGSFFFIGGYFRECARLILSAQGGGLALAENDHVQWRLRRSPGLHGIALLEMFGFLSVEHGRLQEGQGWQIEHVLSTPLGIAVFALLGEKVFGDFDTVLEFEENPSKSFGALQPAVQPYVPAWRNILSLSARAFREGVHVFKVSLGRDLWRRIAAPGELALDTLADTILNAFQFDHDHLYQFSYRDQFGVKTHANHPYMDEGPWASEVRVGDVPLPEGQSITYLFDFGDQWEFDVTLERVDPADAAARAPAILDGRGEAPDQYPSWDE